MATEEGLICNPMKDRELEKVGGWGSRKTVTRKADT
jgi:hypothetical protein